MVAILKTVLHDDVEPKARRQSRAEPKLSVKVRAVRSTGSSEKRHHAACAGLLALAAKTPTVKTASKGITAELRRLRDRGDNL